MRFSDYRIVVSKEKIVNYLLSTTHMVGQAKAKFFRSLGFDDQSVDLFEKAIVEIAQSGEISEEVESPYGKKYIIDGMLVGVEGKQSLVRTVWIQQSESKDLQLVTAYPKRKE